MIVTGVAPAALMMSTPITPYIARPARRSPECADGRQRRRDGDVQRVAGRRWFERRFEPHEGQACSNHEQSCQQDLKGVVRGEVRRRIAIGRRPRDGPRLKRVAVRADLVMEGARAGRRGKHVRAAGSHEIKQGVPRTGRWEESRRLDVRPRDLG